MVTALWIIYGAAIALRMAMFTQTAISWQEGLVWFAAAILLSVLAFFRESAVRRGSDRAITGLREQLIKLQGFSEGTASAMGRSLTRMEELPGTTPKSEEIVSELREGLREFREGAKALTESTTRSQPVPVAITPAQRRIGYGILVVLISALVLAIGLTIKNAYDLFPDPLSPAEMSDLTDRLRKENPQKVMIVRTADRQSIALAEQLRQIFESAHWALVEPPRSPSKSTILIRGVVVWHAPADYQAFVFSRALHASARDFPYQVATDIEMTDSGYFELSISDGWLAPVRP
jgi:hypothetical protein